RYRLDQPAHSPRHTVQDGFLSRISGNQPGLGVSACRRRGQPLQRHASFLIGFQNPEERMIRLENASKKMYIKGSSKTILDNVSLVIRRGRSVGLLGRNGAGKSTMLKLIAGTLRLDGGRIIRQGKISWPLGFAGTFQGNLTGEQN